MLIKLIGAQRSMADETLYSLYVEAFSIRQQTQTLKDRLLANFEKGIEAGYLNKSTNDINVAITQYHEKLKSELEAVIKAGDFKKAEELIHYINYSITSKTNDKEQDEKSKPDTETSSEISYKTPLPDSVYKESGKFVDLLKNARKYRNVNETSKLTWVRLAKYSKISLSYFGPIKKGRIPSQDAIKRLAVALGGDSEKFLKIAGKI